MMTDRYGLPAGDELGATLAKIATKWFEVEREMATDDMWETKPDDVLIDWFTRIEGFINKSAPFTAHLKSEINSAKVTKGALQSELIHRNIFTP